MFLTHLTKLDRFGSVLDRFWIGLDRSWIGLTKLDRFDQIGSVFGSVFGSLGPGVVRAVRATLAARRDRPDPPREHRRKRWGAHPVV